MNKSVKLSAPPPIPGNVINQILYLETRGNHSRLLKYGFLVSADVCVLKEKAKVEKGEEEYEEKTD